MRPSYSALLVLPTGGGKTYVASAWLIKAALDKGKKVLWLAHRTLLLDQAAEAFLQYTYEKDHPLLSPFRYRIVSGTSNHCRPSRISPKDNLLLVSKDSVTRNVKCLDHWLEGTRELYLIIDEAHHSPAKSYRRIIDHIQEKVPCVKMIGLTATPFRKDLDNTGPLREIFRDDIVYASGTVLAKNIFSVYCLQAFRLHKKEYRHDFPIPGQAVKPLAPLFLQGQGSLSCLSFSPLPFPAPDRFAGTRQRQH